jgi:hypothetical protein
MHVHEKRQKFMASLKSKLNEPSSLKFTMWAAFIIIGGGGGGASDVDQVMITSLFDSR